MTVKIDGESLRIEDVVRVARHGDFVQLTDVAGEKVLRSRQVLEALAKNSKRPIYGVNTGFGRLVTKRISPDELRQLQENLILSHSAGVGFPLPQEVVRATMLLRVNSLAKGYSGVRLVILDTLVEMLNKKVHPVVPRKGSLGASGDLAPLAHIAAVMLGRGKAYFNGTPFSGEVAMGKAGIKTIKLESKEGLALINGTQASSAVLSLAAYNSEHLLKMSDVLGALSVFMLNGNISQFAQEIQSVRPHPGQIISAKNLRRLFGDAAQGSRENLQDAYSLRCIPQVHGAVRAALRHAISVLVTEINSATDNPLVFPEENEILSGGNFHGEPIALIADYLKLAMAELGSISERRTNRLLHPDLNGDLPPFLVDDAGLNSGYMLAHYTAASLVAENKVLAHPSCVDSIPVSGDQEDHVSMGMNASLHLSEVVKNVGYILAVELLCACQANEYVKRPIPKALGGVYQAVREEIPAMKKDEEVYPHIEAANRLVWGKTLLETVKRSIGELD